MFRLFAAARLLFDQKTQLNSRRNGMDDICEAQMEEMVSSDSAYGSWTVDMDTEDGHSPADNSVPYNEDLTHKVST